MESNLAPLRSSIRAQNHAAVSSRKILIASLSDAFAGEMQADSAVYRRHYRSVEAQSYQASIKLQRSLNDVTVLHLFARVSRAQ